MIIAAGNDGIALELENQEWFTSLKERLNRLIWLTGSLTSSKAAN
jgi:hypothetical protein